MQELLAPLFSDAETEPHYDGVVPSPKEYGYRNKMEFSFGDEKKDGPLQLGLHKVRSRYDIVSAESCLIVEEDIRAIIRIVLAYCKEKGLPHYHKKSHKGYLRHLLVRRSESDGQLMVLLVTSSQIDHDFRELEGRLRAGVAGSFAGILHGINDALADAVQCDRIIPLYGTDHLTEQVLGLSFRLTLFSFFQTNTKAAEAMYDLVRRYLHAFLEEKGRKPVLYDLYSGTGTIAQILAPSASHVYGIEIVEEAVLAARSNARDNGIGNCTFLCGDVGKVLGEIEERPDYIILDPPREGVLPKALSKIAAYEVPHMIYISCKPTSFVRDMTILSAWGYAVDRYAVCDLFPFTKHAELVVSLYRKNNG